MSLKVFFPEGGKFFLLHWWSYNERGNVILTKNIASLETTAKCALKKYGELEFKSFFEIEIVAPSKQLNDLVSEAVYKEEVINFHREMCGRLSETVKHKVELIEPFKVCSTYVCNPDMIKYAAEDPSYVKYHLECLHCFAGIKCNISKEELHQRYYDKWQVIHPNKRIDKRVISKATPALDGETLWYARANFGHHSGGLELEEVDYEIGYWVSFSNNIIFLFRKLNELDCSKFQTMADQAQKDHKKWQEEQSARRRDQFDKDQQDKSNEVINFFKEN